MAVKFLRRTWNKYSKLGLRRKKKQVWRRPRGRDNKMREKKKGRPAIVSIGYGKPNKKKFLVVYNLKEMGKTQEKEMILGKIGKKKKIELCKEAKKKNIKFKGVDIDKFLKENLKEEAPKDVSSTKSKDVPSKGGKK